MNGIVLDLCGGGGAWSRPYQQDASYEVHVVDLATTGEDVRDFAWYAGGVVGVLAAPPCTEFAGSGARWWAGKPPHLLEEAVEVVRACLRIIKEVRPLWWALENPVGRLGRCVPELGKLSYSWQPYEFGDPWSKRTCMWGAHVRPSLRNVTTPDPMRAPWRLPPSPDRAALRSITPPGFAQAFFEANP